MKKGFLLTALGAACWGFSGTCGQFLFMHAHISSSYLTTMRMLIAGGVLMIITFINSREMLKRLIQNKRDLLQLCIFAIGGLAFSQWTYLTAISYSNAATATVLQYLYPTLLVILTCLKDHRFPQSIEVLCIVLATLGTFVLATHGHLDSLNISMQGLLWGILAAIAACSYTLTPEKLMHRYGSLPIVSLGMMIGGLFMGIAFQSYKHIPALDISGILAMLAIGLIGTALAFTMYLFGVSTIGAIKASMLASLEPVSAAICSFFWLHTTFQFTDFLGFFLIMATVFILAKAKEKAQ